MRGQWIGRLEGEVPGVALVDLDERPDRYTGTGLFVPENKELPSTGVIIDTLAKAVTLEFDAEVFAVNELTRAPMLPAELEAPLPEYLRLIIDHGPGALLTLRMSCSRGLTSRSKIFRH